MTAALTSLGGRMAAAAARGAAGIAPDSRAAVREFLLAQGAPGGGFVGRDGAADLYYTQFGLAAAFALGLDLPEPGLRDLLDRTPLPEDLPHLAALARCGMLAGASGEAGRSVLLARLATFRRPAGGYALLAGDSAGSVYGTFLAILAAEALGAEEAALASAADFVRGARAAGGGFANGPGEPEATVPATAAALAVLWRAAAPAAGPDVEWLAGRHADAGGFCAGARTARPDLLSTATALFALTLHGFPVQPLRKPCISFIEDLWLDSGGFAGCIGDAGADCEYTYYGLLALGCLL